MENVGHFVAEGPTKFVKSQVINGSSSSSSSSSSSRHPSVPGDYGVSPLVNKTRTVSALAAEPSVGVAVSTALCTAECRGRYVFLGLRLSAGSLFLCLRHQGVFRRRETLLSPGTPVACQRLPGVSVDR